MEIKIDFGEPIIQEEVVLSIQPNDLDDFYIKASDFDKSNLFFMLLTSLHHYEDRNDTQGHFPWLSIRQKLSHSFESDSEPLHQM